MPHDFAIAWEWLSFGVRWLHIITAIAWIGSSFYFIALDLGLNRERELETGADGEEWQVHGGGFYHVQKYLVAPAAMPEHLTWFKWESYATWLSGAALLAIVYWAGAEMYLIDPAKADLAVWQAVAISALSLTIGWLVYDFLCKSPLGERPTTLMVLLFVLLTVMGWAYTQVFTGRAALLHLGAFTATIMTANVFAIIMPNQRIVVADLKAGRKPDPKYGKIAKLRSTHNNYLTLPVIFLMLSHHNPLATSTQYNWVIASLVFLMGVTIRHWFNTRHARAGSPTWTWLVTAILFVLIAWLSTAPDLSLEEAQAANPQNETARLAALKTDPLFEEASTIVQGRCSMCHAAEPSWEGMIVPPKGVILAEPEQIARHARTIYLQAGRSTARSSSVIPERFAGGIA
ncbi:MAG: urate hydroxylase PuuD [Pseudomonadota bacterium]